MICKVIRMTGRYDTFLLDCLRAERESCVAEKIAVNDRTDFTCALPRAAGRVVPWAMTRAVDVLSYGARRPLRLGDGPEATPDERVILTIVEALRQGDEDRAARAAEWIVKPSQNAALMRALGNVAAAL